MYLYNIIMLRVKHKDKDEDQFDDIFLYDSYAPLKDNAVNATGCLPPFMYRFLKWVGLY